MIRHLTEEEVAILKEVLPDLIVDMHHDVELGDISRSKLRAAEDLLDKVHALNPCLLPKDLILGVEHDGEVVHLRVKLPGANPPPPFPTYNHTRGDGLDDPCPECKKLRMAYDMWAVGIVRSVVTV